MARLLDDYKTGMLSGPERQYQHVEWDIDGRTDYVIFSSEDSGDRRRAKLLEENKIRLLKRFDYASCWLEVYAVNK